MAKTPEAKNSTYVDTHIDKTKVRSWKIHDSFTIGKPDSEYIRRDGKPGRTHKIEYKFMPELPKRDTTLVAPSWTNELQRVRLGEYFTADGNAWAVTFVGRTDAQCIVFCNKEEWDNGITTAVAKQRLISRKALASMLTFWVTLGEAGELPPQFEIINNQLRAKQ